MKKWMMVAAGVLGAGWAAWVWGQEPAGTRPGEGPIESRIYDIHDLLVERADTSYKKMALTMGDGDPVMAPEPAGSGMFGLAEEPKKEAPRTKSQEVLELLRLLAGEPPAGEAPAVVGGTLVVRRTRRGHEKVAAALAQIKALAGEQVVVDAAWVRGADVAGEAGVPRTLSAAAMARAQTPWRGRVTCYNAQQSYMLAGQAHAAVVGFKVEAPEIAGQVTIKQDPPPTPPPAPESRPASKPGTPEEKKDLAKIEVNCATVPILRMAHTGLAMDVRPVLSGDRKSCHVELSGLISRPRTAKPAVLDKTSLTELDVDVQRFAASVSVALDTWTVVAGSTVPEPLGKGELYLVVRAIRVEAGR